jgi:hypothetical protein
MLWFADRQLTDRVSQFFKRPAVVLTPRDYLRLRVAGRGRMCLALGIWALAGLLWLPASASADAESKSGELIGDVRESGAIGRSRGNWVAVPVPLSNPTLGTGLQAALMYLHPKRPGEELVPNATSGLGVMYTNTGSWFAGAFHQNSWDHDRYRFTGFIGSGELQLHYYSVGSDSTLASAPLDYAFGVSAVSSELQVRLPATEHWYAGLRYVYMRSESVFDLATLIPALPPTEINVPLTSAGLGLLLTYDSRDDNYYPTRGQYLQAGWTDYGESWGGDLEFEKSTTFYNYYHSFSEHTLLALRTRLEATSDSAPFFFLSSLAMRGFSRDRYLDNYTLSVHAEARHKFAARWGGVAFTEAGWFADSFSGLADSRTIVSYGAGLRWQVTQDKSLNLGLDAAFSSDDRAVYVKIGEAF